MNECYLTSKHISLIEALKILHPRKSVWRTPTDIEADLIEAALLTHEITDRLTAYKLKYTPEYISRAVKECELFRSGKISGDPAYEWPPEQQAPKHIKNDNEPQ